MSRTSFDPNNIPGMATALGRVVGAQSCDALRAVGQGERSYVVVHGLPAVSSDQPGGRAVSARIWLWGALPLLGGVVTSYESENDGDPERIVKPRKQHGNEASTAGAGALPAHTDMAYLTFPQEESDDLAAAPDFLVLSCVRNDPEVPTRLIDVATVLGRMRPENVQVLRSPRFTLSTPQTVTPVRQYADLALVGDPGDGGGPMMRYRADLVTAQDKHAEAALEDLNAVLEQDDIGEDIVLRPGSLLAFDNRRALHARPAIDTQSCAGERLLYRIYGQRLTTRILREEGAESRLNQLA